MVESFSDPKAQKSKKTEADYPVWPAFSAPLGELLSDGFDHKAFRKAIKADDRLSPEQKKHAIDLFRPDAEVVMKAGNPVKGITAHVEAGASRDCKQPAEMLEQKAFARDKMIVLSKPEPIAQMWDEVWQQTLVHYAAEATEYEQIMSERGKSMMDDPSGYPARTPPISLVPDMGIINAAAGLSEEGKSIAMVTRGFVEKLTPDEQRAILFHEAQHAFEAVLEGRTPAESMTLHGIGSLLTSNHVSRHFEHRADFHSARMGSADAMESAFRKMGEDQGQYFKERAAVMHHLKESGFHVDVEAVTQVFTQVTAAARQQMKQLQQSDAESILIDDDTALEKADEPSRKPPFLLRKLGQLAEKFNDTVLNSQVGSLNARIEHGAAHGAPTVAVTQQPAAQPEAEPEKKGGFREKILSKAGGLAQRIEEARRTHPPTKDRIEHVQKVDACGGCADPSPFASHEDRVKAISKSGIQGIVAGR